MNQDQNLLFGIFAVQLKKVTPSQLMAAAAAWLTDPDIPLAERLVREGALDTVGRDLIERLVDEAVKAHNNDATQALESFGGAQTVYETFHGSIAPSGDTWVKAALEDTTTSETPDLEGHIHIREIPNRYKEISEQGRGGMGRVLLVHDEALGRNIVLKELLPETGGRASSRAAHEPKARPHDKRPANEKTPPDTPPPLSPMRASARMLARLLQEAKITGQLEHPNITPVYELGLRKDGSPYYTMKLVRGKTLAEALDECKTIRDRLALLPHFADLCQAVAYAHSRGVIHRDLKPANVMIGEFGETVVLDWGLAKVIGKPDAHADRIDETVRLWNLGDIADGEKTSPGEILGTPLYMAPEQAKGQHEFVDHRTDVYALGAILYHLLTGQPPFKWTTPVEVLNHVATKDPEPIKKRTKDAPPELIAICNHAMAKRPASRYPTTRKLTDDIQNYMAGAIVQVHSYTLRDQLRRLVKNHRPAVYATVGATAVVASVVIFAFWRVTAERDAVERQGLVAVDTMSGIIQALPSLESNDPNVQSAGKERILRDAVSLLAFIIEDDPSFGFTPNPAMRRRLALRNLADLNSDDAKATTVGKLRRALTALGAEDPQFAALFDALGDGGQIVVLQAEAGTLRQQVEGDELALEYGRLDRLRALELMRDAEERLEAGDESMARKHLEDAIQSFKDALAKGEAGDEVR